MSEEDLHQEGFLLRYLRLRLGWSQADLGAAVDLSEAEINHYELERRRLRPQRRASLTAAMDYSELEVRLYRMLVKGCPPSDGEGAHEELAALAPLPEAQDRLVRRSAAEHGVFSAQGFQGALEGTLAQAVVLALRREGERAFRGWAQAPRGEQRLLLETHPGFQSQALVEQVCLASTRAAAKDPKVSLHYAQLALRAAERLRDSPSVRSRVQGYAWAFVGNARRVGTGLDEADEAFVQSDRLWAAGAKAQGVFLEAWRLPDLKASLRRDQRRWRETLALSDRALAEAPLSAHGRILVKKATALLQMGELAAALPILEAAAPLVEASGDREVLLTLHINLAVNFTHVGRLKEARGRVEEARRLAVELGKDLHLVRCVWVSGVITGESGQLTEALSTLAQVRGDFTTREMPLEAASVALDEAIYLLQAGETQRVATLAEEVAWVFAKEGVGEEALKALRLFYDAARQQRITLELARQLRDRFQRAA